MPGEILSEGIEVMTRWLQNIAEGHNRFIKNLVYNFVDNEQILDINRKYLQHDYYTDIITFDYCRGKNVSGEVYISVDEVKDQALRFKVDTGEEMRRVVAHGLLHLCGFNDATDEEKQVMRMEEEKALLLHAQISDD